MKKKLLWIGIPSVLIIATVGFVFFNMKNGVINQDIIENTELEQEILPYHRIGEDEIGWQYLPASECYNEEGNINENLDTEKYGIIVNCFDINGNKHGTWIYNRDGQAISYYDYEDIAVFVPYKNGESPVNQQDDICFQIISDYKKDILNYNSNGKNIEIIGYYDNGQIASKGQINDGEIEGKHTLYYKNGQIAIEIEFKNGLENGKYISYYRNGKIDEEGEFLNGQKYGKWIEYYKNGQIFREWNMINGHYNGEYIMYNEEGNIDEKGEFLNGQKHGKWGTYNVNGQIITSGAYINGLQNGERVGYYANGGLKRIGSFVNGKLDGKQISYYENGKIEEENIYDNGKLIQRNRYYENGNLVE